MSDPWPFDPAAFIDDAYKAVGLHAVRPLEVSKIERRPDRSAPSGLRPDTSRRLYSGQCRRRAVAGGGAGVRPDEIGSRCGRPCPTSWTGPERPPATVRALDQGRPRGGTSRPDRIRRDAADVAFRHHRPRPLALKRRAASQVFPENGSRPPA
jgi:hypothetical protein